MKDFVNRLILPYCRARIAEHHLPQDQVSVLIVDAWQVHLSADFKDFIRRCVPKIELNYIPAGTTPKAQVMDISVNYTIKSIVSHVTCDYIAGKVATLLKESPEAVPIVEVGLGSLKPVIVKGFLQSVSHFEGLDGAATIKKGWGKAGVLRCFEKSFQATAATWMANQLRESNLNTVLMPHIDPLIEIPPSTLIYVGYEDRHEDDDLAMITLEDIEELDELLEAYDAEQALLSDTH